MTPILFSVLFMTVSKDWRPYYYSGLAISFTAWIAALFIPESPSLLLAQGKYQEARGVIGTIAKVNRSKAYRPQYLFQQEYDFFMSSKYDNDTIRKDSKPKGTSKPLKKHLQDAKLKQNLAILCGCWMASTFSYYMILFYMKYLPGNIFVNTIYCSSADTIGYLFTGILF